MNKYLALFKFVFRIFIGQPIGVVMGFILPSTILVILPYVITGTGSKPIQDVLQFIVPGLITLPVLIMGLLGIPITLTTLKESSILKKTNVLNVKPSLFIFAFLSVFIVLMITGSVWIFILSKIIWQSSAPNPANAAFLVPYMMTAFITIFIGLQIGNMAKTAATGFALGIMVFLPFSFLSGTMFPQVVGTLNKIAKFIPTNETTMSMKNAWMNGTLHIKDMSASGWPFSMQIFNAVWKDTLLTYLYPSLFIVVMSVTVTKTLKWE